MRPFGPKAADHPSIGEKCPACHQPFRAGDMTTLVSIGPGDSEEERARRDAGHPYKSVAVEVHWECSNKGK